MDEINENLSNIFSGTELKPAIGHVFINVPHHQIYTIKELESKINLVNSIMKFTGYQPKSKKK